MPLYRTQPNKTGVPGQVHTASVSPLYPLLSLFFFQVSHANTLADSQSWLQQLTNSPSHSYLIMTKHCNSPGSTHGTLTGYSLPQKDEKKRLGTNVPHHLFPSRTISLHLRHVGPAFSFPFSLSLFSLFFFIQSSIQSILHFSILIHNCLNVLSYTMLESSSNYYP